MLKKLMDSFIPRFIVVQSVGLTLLAGLYFMGVIGLPFVGISAYICWLIVAMAGLGILNTFLQKWDNVSWIATHVVRIGLLGTVIGLIIAFAAAGHVDPANIMAVKGMITGVVNGMYVSLYATLMGISTNLWLKINLRLLGNKD